MKYSYNTFGTCSAQIIFDVEDELRNGTTVKVVRSVEFLGGCSGNLQGIGRLVEGMPVEDVIARLRGIDCGGKGTSCPDQLSRALRAVLDKQ